jgi:serine phosphatase RsbU (regulator of sigma subunit)/anti-sigma regulatory factor (Ser/Thr protein kinase)
LKNNLKARQQHDTRIEMVDAGLRSIAIEEDLLIARKIQAAMIPQRLPSMEGLEMASLYLPSGAVGGDLFDVIQISEDILALFIFDVAGHGVSAALISSMAKVSFSDHIRGLLSPRLVMERVNAQMIRNISTDYYLTAVVAYLDMHDNKLTYCNAGHAYPIVYNKKERSVEALNSTGIFVGVTDQGLYEEKSLYLNPGDWLFFFTDGIYRIFGADNELRGRQLFEREILKSMNNASPQSFIEALRTLHEMKNADGDPVDDVTAVVIEFLTQSRKNQIRGKLGFTRDDPVYLQFISYFEEMDRAAAVILSAMDSLGYPDESIRKMKIILTELFANAIYHGNGGDYSKKVTVGHIVNKQKVVVSIMDEGKGFDPKKIPDPTLPENLVKDCGRGLFIVRSYVDSLEFNTAGNRVTVVKHHTLR